LGQLKGTLELKSGSLRMWMPVQYCSNIQYLLKPWHGYCMVDSEGMRGLAKLAKSLKSFITLGYKC